MFSEAVEIPASPTVVSVGGSLAMGLLLDYL